MAIPFLILVFSIVLLYFGAEFTLNAAEKIGNKLGLSPFIIGMVLIGFGTSLPEMFVGHIAGMQGRGGVAVGSLLGSNIANMFLVLGLAGIITKMSLDVKGITKHLLIHVILGIVLIFVLKQPKLDFIAGAPLLFLCAVYLVILYRDMVNDKKSAVDQETEEEVEDFNTPKVTGQLLIGFVLLFAGGELLVKSGTQLTSAFGVSEYIVSVILLAFGTSFPELVTAVMAAYRKKDTNLIIGNIVGSNLFNCALILGSLGVYKLPLSGSYKFELFGLIGGAVALLILNLFKAKFAKIMGFLFLTSYTVIVLHWVEVI
jgi:cation:H+ antiporter